jgi:hypothetical protein
MHVLHIHTRDSHVCRDLVKHQHPTGDLSVCWMYPTQQHMSSARSNSENQQEAENSATVEDCSAETQKQQSHTSNRCKSQLDSNLDTSDLPIHCGPEYVDMHTPAQRTYCESMTGDTPVTFQVTDKAQTAPGFVYLWGGREVCKLSPQKSSLWVLASADAGLQFVQKQMGCECVHCVVAQALEAKGHAGVLPLSPLLRKSGCDELREQEVDGL